MGEHKLPCLKLAYLYILPLDHTRFRFGLEKPVFTRGRGHYLRHETAERIFYTLESRARTTGEILNLN